MSNTPTFKTMFDPMLEHLQAVERLIVTGELTEAANRLNVLQKGSPRDPRLFLMGVALAETAGSKVGAIQAAEMAVKVAPDWAPGLIEFAAVLVRQGLFDRALQQADKAIAAKSANLAVYERAVGVANTAGDLERAARYLKGAQKISPDDLSVRRALGYNLLERGQHADALAVFNALMDVEPDNEIVRSGRARAALKLGEIEQAQSDFDVLRSLVPSSEIYAFYGEIAHGRTPKSQPAAIAQDLFDGYARRFDTHLVGELHYRVPRRISELIKTRFPDLNCTLLDLGCGTGLVGVYLGKPKGGLVGVELSGGMIAEAIKHNLYDRFHQVDLRDALRESPTAEFSAITAADVFIYVGDIEEIVRDARRVLMNDGMFVFSCEATKAGEPDLILRDTMRYAHSESTVRAMCEAAGFKQVDIESFDLRNEGGAPVAGYIVHAYT